MPWSLLASMLPFVILLVLLGIHQLKNEKKFKEHKDESTARLRPIAKMADEAHKKKFGRPSTELSEEFPELRAVK